MSEAQNPRGRRGCRYRFGYNIFVMSGPTLEHQQKLSYDGLKIEPKTQDRNKIAEARAWMCQNFFDVRAFGAVMSTTDFNCGQVRGPLQITFARSLDRVFTTEHAITWRRTQAAGAKSTTGSTEMGRKHTIAYGLYRAYGFLNPVFARQTGFSNEDLDLVWGALGNMFDIDRSAARGLMAARRLFVFKHNSALGEAPAHRLFESVKAKLKEGVVAPRSFDDYEVFVLTAASPPPGQPELLDPLALAALA